jgi:hypothetical protein
MPRIRARAPTRHETPSRDAFFAPCSACLRALAGTCTPCSNNLPANAAYVAAGATKAAESCPWTCQPGFTEVGSMALAGPSCVLSVGGAAGLKALETQPGAALGGGMGMPLTQVVAGGAAAGPAAAAAAAAPAAAAAAQVAAFATPAPATQAAPTESGESTDTANTR